MRTTPERLTFGSISPRAAARDRHPIVLLTEGEIFSGIPRDTSRMVKAGKRVYNAFRKLVLALEPMYAAITVEIPLPCPTDLQQKPMSLAFRDFFVGERYLGRAGLASLAALFRRAYQEALDGGLYVSCTAAMNPRGVALNDDEAQSLSIEAAARIAAAYTTTNPLRDSEG